MNLTPSPFVIALLAAAAPAVARDGQGDFDWEVGRWKTEVTVLRNPLSGEPPNWVEYRGETVVKPVLEGRANLVELSVSGPAGKVEGTSLRLYSPQSAQWSINFASLADGLLTAPVFGTFDAAGKGVFVGTDRLGAKTILVRFVVTRRSSTSANFEQAFSGDGGATWETNWIATDTLICP